VANGVVYVGSKDDTMYAFGSITVPQPSPPAVPEFPNQAIDFTLLALTLCIAFAVTIAKNKKIIRKI